MEGRYRLSQKLGAFCPLGPSRLGPERETQVVLGRGPALRQLLARVNFQGASVGGDRGRQMFVARLCLHANPELIVSDTYVNLCLCPKPRISFTIDVMECRFIGLLSLLKSEFECEKVGFEPPTLDGACKGFFRLLCGPAQVVVIQERNRRIDLSIQMQPYCLLVHL